MFSFVKSLPRKGSERVLKNDESDWGPAALALTEHGYVVLPGAISNAGWQGLRGEAEHLMTAYAFFRGACRSR